MRTNQYAFVLALQVVILGALFAFGAQRIDLLVDRASAPDTSEVGQVPAEHGVDDLRGYLSR